MSKIYKHVFCLFFVAVISSKVIASEFDDQPLEAVTKSHRQYFENGVTTIGNVRDIKDWEEVIIGLSNQCWHIRGQSSHSVTKNEWMDEIDRENLKSLLLVACGAVTAVTTGGVSIIDFAVENIIKSLTSINKNQNALQYVKVEGKELSRSYNVTEDDGSRYVLGYFLSIERKTQKTSFIFKTEDKKFEYRGSIVFFEIIPGETAGIKRRVNVGSNGNSVSDDALPDAKDMTKKIRIR